MTVPILLRGFAAAVVFAVLASAGQGAERICFEAEAGTPTDPVRVEEEGKASGGKCVSIPEGAGKPPEVKGDLSFLIDVKKEGRYLLWARCWWDDGCGNSFKLAVDDAEPVVVGEDGTYKRWHWVNLRGVTFQLAAGEHGIKLLNNEDGIKVDQILLLTDRLYVPVAVEKVNCVPKRAEKSPEGSDPKESVPPG